MFLLGSNPGIPIECELTRLACDPSCFCDTCKAYRESIRMRDKTKTLYCRAFSYWCVQTNRWVGDKEYTHADNVEEARLIFYRSENEKVARRLQDVWVAPVIGFFVTDGKGEELSAD